MHEPHHDVQLLTCAALAAHGQLEYVKTIAGFSRPFGLRHGRSDWGGFEAVRRNAEEIVQENHGSDLHALAHLLEKLRADDISQKRTDWTDGHRPQVIPGFVLDPTRSFDKNTIQNALMQSKRFQAA